jgi:hypothetical protein
MTTERKVTRLIREGSFVAEVEITRIEAEHEWAPYYSATDARKIDDVRLALRRGDLKAAAKLARLYELKPVAAE